MGKLFFVPDTKYQNECSKCHKNILVHSEAFWDKENGFNFHTECRPTTKLSPSPTSTIPTKEAHAEHTAPPIPRPISNADIETALDDSIHTVLEKCKQNGIAVNLDLITTIMEWKLEQSVQKFKVQRDAYIASSKQLELQEKIKAWKSG